MKELQIKVIDLDIDDLIIAIQKIAIKILQGYRVGGESERIHPTLGYHFSIIDRKVEDKKWKDGLRIVQVKQNK